MASKCIGEIVIKENGDVMGRRSMTAGWIKFNNRVEAELYFNLHYDNVVSFTTETHILAYVKL